MLKLAYSKFFVLQMTQLTYITHNKSVRILPETALLQSQSPCSIVVLLHESAIFPPHVHNEVAEGLHFSTSHIFFLVWKTLFVRFHMKKVL